MNRLVQKLATIVRAKITQSQSQHLGQPQESRLVFHGPPLSILEQVFNALTSVDTEQYAPSSGSWQTPILLQVPRSGSEFSNPVIGASGRCDENHLLDLRNHPTCSSFVALVPPGQHRNLSVSSTTDEFGISAKSNASNATFDDWWADEFIQDLIGDKLTELGFADQRLTDAFSLIGESARAFDEVDQERSSRSAAWRLISRLFSIEGALGSELGALQALSLACGTPSSPDWSISGKGQVAILGQIADAFSDGFRTGLARLQLNAQDDTERGFLEDFLQHIQGRCKVQTAFERATSAFYVPADELELCPPPTWWKALTAERWLELLSEEQQEADDLVIECVNSICMPVRGMPSLVRDEVALRISTNSDDADQSVDVLMERNAAGAQGKMRTSLSVIASADLVDSGLPFHKAPARYSVEAAGHKASAIKVISLANWVPGIFVTCRSARKVTVPKPPRRGAQGDHQWETELSVAGTGRYELTIYVSPHAVLGDNAVGIQDDSTEIELVAQSLPVRKVADGEYLIEVEAEGRYQLDIPFHRTWQGETKPEGCRVYILCEETQEVGCRSEFERLIKLNRLSVEPFDGKSVVHLDRSARSASLQSWMLEERFVQSSFYPLVLASDYAGAWAPPDWTSQTGSVISSGHFLVDPRPTPDSFQPPAEFILARQKIAERIRENDDQHSGLVESAQLGRWISSDADFRELVERYINCYYQWLGSDPDAACWADVIAIASFEADGYSLSRAPEAILLSPLHPMRLAWHCLAQSVLCEAIDKSMACPAASVLEPGCVPDVLTLTLRTPDGTELVDFISIQSSSDYWAVLWNGEKLGSLPERFELPPLDDDFGITVGGISSSFSTAQITRALDDVSELLSAKPILSLVVASGGGTSDTCNEGLVDWCSKRFRPEESSRTFLAGPRVLQIFDTRSESCQPDEAVVSSLSDDTGNHVHWFRRQPDNTTPDLGIIAQLDSTEPETTPNAARSPLGYGGLVRHRVRRQLPGAKRAFISESRQGLRLPICNDVLADKLSDCILAIENRKDSRIGLRFAPNVNAVRRMLEEQRADFVAVSSSAIDPACFLGQWLDNTYLWDYELPPYSRHAGDTSGYYLLSRIKDADKDGVAKVLKKLPGCSQLEDQSITQLLLEVARRGIPTVRNLSGDDTGALGDLGLFLAVRLLQDQFRPEGGSPSLLPILSGKDSDIQIALVIPVDPFKGYLQDLAISIRRDRKEFTLSRPDLLVVVIDLCKDAVRIKLTPVEVKYRQDSAIHASDLAGALSQAKSLTLLISALLERADKAMAWKIALQHLLLSMIGFGLRVYSQQKEIAEIASRWSDYHERIATAILSPTLPVEVDPTGRVIVIHEAMQSDSHDNDGDGFKETIVISKEDAAKIVTSVPTSFYDAVRKKVGDWNLSPTLKSQLTGFCQTSNPSDAANAQETPNTATSKVAAHVAPAHTQPSQQDEAQSVNTSSTQDAELPSPPEASLSAPKGIVIDAGVSIDGFEPRPIALNVSDTRLNQLNIGVVGDLGTGKTQLLKSLIHQISSARESNQGIVPRFLIFDYKKDYRTPDFVAAAGVKVVRPYRLPLNLFDISTIEDSPAPWLDRFRFFADVLDKIYSGIGPVQRDKLKNAVRSAYEACNALGRAPTIYDIHAEYRRLLNGKSDAPMSIIDDLVDMEIFTRNPDETIPFDKFLDGVVVISLDALGQDDRSKNMLVAVMLNMFYENMLKIPKRPFTGKSPQLRVVDSYLLVDEADNIMRYEFDVLRKLLLQGREFGVGIILASQFLRHFKVNATDYREPLLTWFVHKVPNVTPAELSALGFTSELGELCDRVKTLPNHHCLYKTASNEGEVIRGKPFYELLKPKE